MVAEVLLPQFPLQGSQPGRQFVGQGAVELDQENGRGIATQEVAQPIRLGIQTRGIEHVPVHHLDRRRPVAQDQGSRSEGVEQVCELDEKHGLGSGQLDQLQLGLDGHTKRSLRADEQPGEVELSLTPFAIGNEFIEVVPAHSPQDLGKTAGDFLRVFSGQAVGGAVTGPFPILPRARCLEFSCR